MFTKLFRYSFTATTKNPKVFFDITINNAPSGRIVFEVFFQLISYLPMLHPKLQKTSDNYVLVAQSPKSLANHSTTRDPSSTESSHHSCAKEVTSQITMALAENPFMEEHSKMKTLN